MVLDKLKAASGPVKAYELLEQTRALGLKAPMSVYRALAGLARRGLARKIASLNAFVALRKGAHGKIGPAYLICRRCGRAREWPLDAGQVKALLSAPGFEFDEVVIEVFGDCDGACEGF
jgi:Fur family zinc uptake transcriptional regulator